MVAGPPFVVATAAVAAVARGAPYLFSGRHVEGLVTACILLLGMMQMMSGAVSFGPAAAASTIDGEHAGVQQCCYGGRTMLGVHWLENTNSAPYPHTRFLDSCVTKQGGGAKVARDYQDWRTIPVEGGESFVVNSSARHCKRYQSKIQDAVRTVDTGGVGVAVDNSAGGGRDTDTVHDLARATSDMQLLQRNMSLQRALKQSRKELDRHVCLYVTS